MRDYGKVAPTFWTGKTGKALRGDPDAQLLALYLMTCPHANMIGIFHCPIMYMAHEIGCPLEGASKALQRLIQGGFCDYDEDTEHVFVYRMASFQIADTLKAQDNRVKSVEKALQNQPVERFRHAFMERYQEAFSLTPFQAPSKPLRSQEQEQEQEQEQNPPTPLVRGDVRSVFDFWQGELNHPKAKLDGKRRRKIQQALKSYSVEDCRQAITGCALSPWHMGDNPGRVRYDDITLILRDAEHIERFMSFATSPPDPQASDPFEGYQ